MGSAVLLTVDQISVYKKYRGDEDGFSRVATSAEKSLMRGVNWARVSDLVQSLSLVQRGIAAGPFAQEIKREVREVCADQLAIDALSALAC